MSQAAPGLMSLGEPKRCDDCGAEYMWHHGEAECVRRQFAARFDELEGRLGALEKTIARLSKHFDRLLDDWK